MTRQAERAFMPQDQDCHVIQAPWGVTYKDGAETPVESPKTAVGTTPQEFSPPLRAVAMVFSATGDGKVGGDSTLAEGYKKFPADADYRIPCLNGLPIYIAAASGTIDVDFFFELLSEDET